MLESTTLSPTITSPVQTGAEAVMVGQERWEEIRRMFFEERLAIAEIARRLEVDRKTVRRCLRQQQWQPYRRSPKEETLLTDHADFLRERAAQVQYSAQILFQELRRHRGFMGSYETVKRFVAPLRELQLAAEATQTRFETAPGEQSQIDWGQAKVNFRSGRRAVHFFVLTLGYSRRGFYCTFADERLSQFLDAHERAFEHFGGHTQEHLYDRARTVCEKDEDGRIVWNTTFKSFAQYWGFEPRVCRAYRARTKGKVESGVKYVKRNFLPGREFLDDTHLAEQLADWTATIADVRIHGTTHERPIDRFEIERAHLVPTTAQPSFAHAGRRSRIVASDYLVSFQTNRYSVPFHLIGQTVEIQPHQGQLTIYHHGHVIAEHPLVDGQYQMRILPEHGPGAIARNARQRFALAGQMLHTHIDEYPVEVRDLSLYEELLTAPVAAEVEA